MITIKLASVLLAGVLADVQSAAACDQTIILSNWKSCAVGAQAANGAKSDWDVIPEWTRDEKIKPYFMDDPHLLAEHGLCNEKFHRVVLCLPGWEQSSKDACWFLICSGFRASGG